MLDNQKIKCDRCSQLSAGYYLQSDYTKSLFVCCKNCGGHAIKYIEGLPLPWIPTKRYKKEHLQDRLI